MAAIGSDGMSDGVMAVMVREEEVTPARSQARSEETDSSSMARALA